MHAHAEDGALREAFARDAVLERLAALSIWPIHTCGWPLSSRTSASRCSLSGTKCISKCAALGTMRTITPVNTR